LNEKQKEYIQKIRLGIDQMTELIDDLLNIGRIEAGIGINMAPCRLDTMLKRLALEMDMSARVKGLEFTLDVSPALSPVMADETLLRQAIANLVDNAIKYTHQGFVKLRAYNIQDGVMIEVQDSGIGIPNADLPRLFEKFYRVKTRESLKIHGTGLGLAIVKSIVELHKGRVWAKSELGRGSTFFISLPAHSLEQEGKEQVREQ